MDIISGMHRSGTSLIARLFYEAGADMGDRDQFYRPDKWNPDGYFEQPDIHAINMPLINGPWGKLAYFGLPSKQTILKRAEKRAEQIRQTAARYHGKVVKETRFCLTLPAWLQHGAQIHKIVMCLRDPIQVARSLQKRNYTTISHALRLWYIHNTRLLEHAGDIPVWFVYYPYVLDEHLFVREIAPVLHFFGYQIAESLLDSLQKTCVKLHLNHYADLTVYPYPREIELLWQELRRRHQAQFSQDETILGARLDLR